jgi:cardiolipin synthase
MYMNIPNFLTALRILAIPLFIILFSYDYHFLALVLFVCAAVTDALDGFLARTLHQKTTLGAYLDPIADKLMLSSAFVICSILKIIPLWLSILVISRDIIISLGILVLLVNAFPVEIHPTVMSKCTTVLQILTIGVVLCLHVLQKKYVPVNVLYWTTGLLTIASGIDYVSKGLKIINDRERRIKS